MIKLSEEYHYEIMDGVRVSKQNERYYLYSTKVEYGEGSMEITKETFDCLMNDFAKTLGKNKEETNLSLYDNLLKDINDCEEKGYEIDYIYMSQETYSKLSKELGKDYPYFLQVPISTLNGYEVRINFSRICGYDIVLKELAVNVTPIQHITQRLTKEEISEFVNYILKYYA